MAAKTSTKSTKPATKAAAKSSARKPAQPQLLSAGNPEITKGDGDGPVRVDMAAMPGWKRAVGP